MKIKTKNISFCLFLCECTLRAFLAKANQFFSRIIISWRSLGRSWEAKCHEVVFFFFFFLFLALSLDYMNEQIHHLIYSSFRKQFTQHCQYIHRYFFLLKISFIYSFVYSYFFLREIKN